MRKTLTNVLKVAVTLGLLAWLLASINLSRLGTVLAEASAVGLCLLIALCFSHKCLAAYRWHWLLRCNGPRPPFRDVLRWSLVGGAVSAALPFGAAGTEVARVATAARERWRIGHLASAAILDRLIGVITLTLIVLLGTRLSAIPLPGIQLVALAVLALVGVGVVAAARRWDTHLVALLPARLRLLLTEPLDKLHAALLAFRGNRWGLAYAFVITISFQLVRVCGAYVGCLTLGIDVPFGFIVATFPVVMFVNMLPISLNGIGVREVGLTYALSMAGVGAEQAIALGLTLSALNVMANLPGLVLLFKPVPTERRARAPLKEPRHGAVQRNTKRDRDGAPLDGAEAEGSEPQRDSVQRETDRPDQAVAPRAGVLRR